MLHPVLFLAATAAVQSASPDIPPSLRPEYVQMVDSADYYIARQMWPDAKRCTIEALKTDPANFNNALLFSNLGIINLNLGLVDDAIENFSLGLNIAPASTTLRANRARALLMKNDYPAAQQDLIALTNADTDNQWGWKMLGTTYLAAGDVEKGIVALSRISDPDPDTLRLLASTAVGKGNLDKAREYYDRLLESSPSEDAWFDHAWFLLLANDVQGATDDVRSGIKMYPRSGQLVLLRAYIHRLMHENSLAEADVRLAKEYGVDNELIDTLFPPKKKKK